VITKAGWSFKISATTAEELPLSMSLSIFTNFLIDN